MDDEATTFWDRTFDDGATAKYGCFGCLGFFAILILVGVLTIDRQLGGNTSERAPSMVADEQLKASPSSTAVASGKVDTTSGGDTTTAKIAGEMNIAAMLKDGDTAKFQKEFVSQLDGGNFMLCGMVNSKNSFGAYTGFKRFIASPNPQAPSLIEGEDSGLGAGVDNNFEKAYRFACENRVESFD